mgnify:CR=1 FL=1
MSDSLFTQADEQIRTGWEALRFADDPGEVARVLLEATAEGDDAVDADAWPKPEPIQSELPPVRPFSEDLLPDSRPPDLPAA